LNNEALLTSPKKQAYLALQDARERFRSVRRPLVLSAMLIEQLGHEGGNVDPFLLGCACEFVGDVGFQM
jgi:hypothetical protein